MDEDLEPKVFEHDFSNTTAPVEHAWVQRGNDLVCESCPHPHSSINAVPFGKMLIKTKEGVYDFVPLT